MSLALTGRGQSLEDVDLAQTRTQVHNTASDSSLHPARVEVHTELDVDVEAQPPIVSQPALSRRPFLGPVSFSEVARDAAGIVSKRCYDECRQQRGVGALYCSNDSNESHSTGDAPVTKIIDNVETLQSLLSVRDDILFEIRSLKMTLLDELQSVRNHAANFPKKAENSSPLYQFPIAPVADRIGAPEESWHSKLSYQSGKSSARFSVGSVVTPGRTDSRRSARMSSEASRGATGAVSWGEKVTCVSIGEEKSSARMHDEAILESLRHQSIRRRMPTTSEYIKENVRKSCDERYAYNVEEMYHKTGICQSVARHDLFENVTLAVIIVNALWMFADSDLNDADSIVDAKFIYVLADAMFYTYFVGEILVRFLAFERKASCYKDRWFMFDSLLVILYTVDPFVIGIVQHAVGTQLDLSTEGLRLVRLLRLFRLTRLLRNFPEMLIMIKGIASALATVAYALSLLALVTYVFAIALRNTVPADSEIEIGYFHTVLETMHHLLLYGTFLDNLSEFILTVKQGSIACLVLCWLYICLAHLLILNMLIGILCEVMAAVSIEQREELTVGKIKDKFLRLLGECDEDNDGLIGWEEFAQLLQTIKCQDALRKFDVDVDALVDMVEDQFFCSEFADEKIRISAPQVIQLVVDLRGSKSARVKDVMAVGRRLNMKFRDLKEKLAMFETLIYRE